METSRTQRAKKEKVAPGSARQLGLDHQMVADRQPEDEE
jgi:hypothetical protein